MENITIEVRPIKGHDGYFVSSDGRVFKGDNPKPLDVWVNPCGYQMVRLENDVKYSVHYLVAWTFIKNDGYMCLRHLNGDKTDNRVENLQWYYSGQYDNASCTLFPKPQTKGNERAIKIMQSKGKGYIASTAVEIVDPATAEVTKRFNSIYEFNEFAHVTGGVTYTAERINLRRRVKGYCVQFVGEPWTWEELQNSNKHKPITGIHRAVTANVGRSVDVAEEETPSEVTKPKRKKTLNRAIAYDDGIVPDGMPIPSPTGNHTRVLKINPVTCMVERVYLSVAHCTTVEGCKASSSFWRALDAVGKLYKGYRYVRI